MHANIFNNEYIYYIHIYIVKGIYCRLRGRVVSVLCTCSVLLSVMLSVRPTVLQVCPEALGTKR